MAACLLRSGDWLFARSSSASGYNSLKDIDAKKLAVITTAVTAFIEAERTEVCLEPAHAQSAWALAGRLSQMARSAKMQRRPAMCRAWSVWALWTS